MPTTEQGLRSLAGRPETDPVPGSWQRFLDEAPKDARGTEYVYRCPGSRNPNSYDLFSAGPDRIPDTADDEWGK
jgi:general secretion pathway protein G